jgi:uncharacterized protein YbjT (DUF2867 family)
MSYSSFNVVVYAADVQVFKEGKMIPATIKNKEKAFEWIESLEAIGATIVRGNALDGDAVDTAFASGQFTAAVNTLGGKRGERPRPDIEGTKQIAAGANKAGVMRNIMVTAIGAGDSDSAVSPNVHKFLGEILKLKTEAEKILQESGLDYTILRPGGMTNDPASGTAIKTEDHNRMGVINRADLAALVVTCLDDDETIGKIYHTIDPGITREAPLQRGENLPTGSKH